MNNIIFGYNQTHEKNNNSIGDHQQLVIGGMSDSVKQKVINYEHTVYEAFKPYIKLVELSMVGFFAGIVSIAIIYMATEIINSSFIQTTIFKFIVLSLAVISMIFFSMMLLAQVLLRKKAKNSDLTAMKNDIDNLVQNAADELEVPETSIAMDIFFVRYKIKKNRRLVQSRDNLHCAVFRDEDNINIQGSFDKISFPVSSIDTIIEDRTKIKLSSWNKLTPYNSVEFKNYKIIKKSAYEIYARSLYIVTINVDNTTYEMHIPNYEIDALKNLIEQG